MKKKILFFIIPGLFLSLVNFCVHAQVSIGFNQPPLNQLRFEDMWNLTINNSSSSDQIVYLEGSIEEKSQGLIASGTSSRFTSKLGSYPLGINDLQPVNQQYVDRKYEDIVRKTGTMPDGTYIICVTVYNAGGNELSRDCIEQTIVNVSPPQLTWPGDETTIQDAQPVFQWTPPMPTPPGEIITYRLKIVELLDGQVQVEGMEANPAFFIKDGIRSPSFQFPLSSRPFLTGKKYSWQVTAVDESNGREIGKSAVWALSYHKEQIAITTPQIDTSGTAWNALASQLVSAREQLTVKGKGFNCPSGDLFESGSCNGWELFTGKRTGRNSFNLNLSACPDANSQVTIQQSGDDQILKSLMNKVFVGKYSLKLGVDIRGTQAQLIKYSFQVTPSKAKFCYSYALVMEDGQPLFHPNKKDNPFYRIRAYKGTEWSGLKPWNHLLNIKYSADVNDSYFQFIGNLVYRNWDCYCVDFSKWMGETVTFEFMTTNCVDDAHFCYAYIDGWCDEILKPDFKIPDTICCGDELIADGTASENEVNYFWSIVESDNNWNQIPPEAGEWFTGYAGKQDITKLAADHGLTLKCNTFYRVKLALSNACTGWQELVKLVYFSRPVADAGPDTSICCNDVHSVVLQNKTSVPPPSECKFSWFNSVVLQDGSVMTMTWSNEYRPTVFPMNGGANPFYLKVTDKFGCTDIDTVVVWVDHPFRLLPITQTASSYSTCCNPLVVLSANPTEVGTCPAGYGVGRNHYYYLWSTGETTQSIRVNPRISATYSVIVSNGCGTERQQITIGDYGNKFLGAFPNLYIPNAFSPFHSPGVNDLFYVVSSGDPPYYNAVSWEFIIYSRWGNAAAVDLTGDIGSNCSGFSNNSIPNWNGKTTNHVDHPGWCFWCSDIEPGEEYPLGTYNYTLVLKNCNNEYKYNGRVTILR